MNGLISPSSHPIHKLFRLEVEDDLSLKRRGLYEVSIGLGKESYENENDWLNYCDRYFGAICLALSPSLRYLISSAEYPKDLWTKLDRTFGKHNEDHYINL